MPAKKKTGTGQKTRTGESPESFDRLKSDPGKVAQVQRSTMRNPAKKFNETAVNL